MVERSDIPLALTDLLSADGDGPATRIDAATATRMVEHAIAQVYAAPAVSRPLRPLRTKVHKLGWSVAAAFAIAGSAAAMYAVQRARTPEVKEAGPARSAAAKSAQPSVIPAPVLPAPSAQAPSVQAPSVRPLQNTAPAPSATPPRVPARSASAGDDLLERANRLRGEGDYRAAERTYSQVVTSNPHGAAAYAARVAAASLRVERLSDPRGALRLYAQALSAQPQGALAPEIHEGMASAYRLLERRDDERHALRALLDAQPTGAAAERARARLAVLSVGTSARAR